MTELIKYHVVAGYDLASAISDGKQLATLDDQTLTFTVTGTTVKIDSKARQPSVFDAPSCGTSGSVAQLAVVTPDLSTLVAASSAASLVGVFNGTDIYS